MLTIHGVPLSVHTRKVIIAAKLKSIDHKLELVIPVVPGAVPPSWASLSPTGLIPVIQDGGFTLADSTAICHYLERKRPSPPLLPEAAEDYGRALWFDAYAGGTIFRHVVHPLFHQKVVGPNIRKRPTDEAVVGAVLGETVPEVFTYLESQLDGDFLVGGRLTLADIAIVSNLLVYRYMGLPIDTDRYPRLARYFRRIVALDLFREALAEERPYVEQMGLSRSFLD
jgi:glutathione S-transferase